MVCIGGWSVPPYTEDSEMLDLASLSARPPTGDTGDACAGYGAPVPDIAKEKERGRRRRRLGSDF